MSEERETNKSSLVKVEGQGLTTRSSSLARRGLEQLQGSSLTKVEEHGLTNRASGLARRELERLQGRGKRVLHFHLKRSLGLLFVGEWAEENATPTYKKDHVLCEAIGAVEIPIGQFVILEISSDGIKQFTALNRLKSDDLNGIDFNQLTASISDIHQLSRLSALQYLNLDNTNIGGRDWHYLSNLKNLIELSSTLSIHAA